jgi:ABC-type ATPase involved in cell division
MQPVDRTPNVIEFQQVDFAYGAKRLFFCLSFDLKRGQYLVISGPARSGKSTLVQMIAGLVIPIVGKIIIDGDDLSQIAKSRRKLRDWRRKIGGVGGIYSLLSDRSILENIALTAELLGQRPRTARKNALEACRRYHLTHVQSHRPDMVSEVERRAALLARAEVARKDIIVADAPTDGLDDQSARFIQERLAALHLAGASILYFTSATGPASGPDKYLCLEEGRVLP